MKTNPGVSALHPCSWFLITGLQSHPGGAACHQHCGLVMRSVKTRDEKLRYLWACGAATTRGGGERQVDVIHGVFHQGPLDHVHVGDGEDALPGRPWDPPFIPVLVHLSEQRDPLTLQDTARKGPCATMPRQGCGPCLHPVPSFTIYHVLCSEKPSLLDPDKMSITETEALTAGELPGGWEVKLSF